MEHVQADIFIAVRSPNPLEETMERITGVIKARLLDPGDRLPPERDLAVQLGISRSTLRIALQTLVDAGWLEVRRGRRGGSFVARWPYMPPQPETTEILHRYRSDLPALLDYRRAVESMAGALAAERATPASIAILDALTADHQVYQEGLESFRAADTRFHIGVARAANSPLVMHAVTHVQEAITEVLDVLAFYHDTTLEHATDIHRRIFEAVRNHDPEAASRLMLEHLADTEELLSSLLQEY